MSMQSGPIARVAHWLVTPDNPPRGIDGMDSERCAALHNAIYEHGWIASGRSVEGFHSENQTTSEHYGQVSEERLHPSLRAFLREARVSPDVLGQPNFFFHVNGLYGPCHEPMWYNSWLGGDDPNRILTLYGTYMHLATQTDGLVYDQHLHKAIMHFDLTDDLKRDPDQPWQKLECILTVWVEMIRRQKIVALPDDVGRGMQWKQDQGGIWHEIIGPERDLTTGAMRISEEMEPWTATPWTPQDLGECLELWDMIVESIEQKTSPSEQLAITTNDMALGESQPRESLLDAEILNAAHIPDGFAREFLSKAQKPRFKYIAPGHQIPSADDFPRNHSCPFNKANTHRPKSLSHQSSSSAAPPPSAQPP